MSMNITISDDGKTALLIVDVQNDFLDGGALGVSGSMAIIPVIEKLLQRCRDRAILSVASADWHPEDHLSFTAHGGPWPPHCVRRTHGAKLHNAIAAQAVIYKGTEPDRDAYSAFGGGQPEGLELVQLLKGRGITHLWVVGIATDYCVKATVLDALEHGFTVEVVTDAIAAVNIEPGDGQGALDAMVSAGATLITSDELLTR